MRTFIRRAFGLLALVLGLLSLAACHTTGGGGTPTYLIRVERGDTLASIAVKYDTTWDKVAKLNNLSPGDAPKIGSVIRVQPGPGGLVADDGTGARRKAGKAGGAKRGAGGDEEFSEADFPDVEREGEGGGKHGFFYGGSGTAGLEWPLLGELSSGYGMRHGRFHHGVDIRAKKGTTVLAAGTGVVEFAGRQNGYGKVIIIRHNSLKTVYAHLDDINVNVGDKVTHATTIGATGLSGNSTGPHLHFEIRNLKDQSIDPMSVMKKNKMLTARR
jgi:murein DD-endopeptidase MepM/ murein hydrolase activator NlpD